MQVCEANKINYVQTWLEPWNSGYILQYYSTVQFGCSQEFHWIYC